MLSLSPRYDLFKFSFPKDFLPEVINEKYNKIINKNPGVLTTSIDYLNESIQSITIPGISDINIQQQQHSSNSIKLNDNKTNVEPKTDITYTSSTNPLDKINKEFKVTFRMNHGLYNYFMIYETIFYRICKPFKYWMLIKKKHKLDEEIRIENERKAEERRIAEEARKAEERRIAEEKRKIEEAKQAEAARLKAQAEAERRKKRQEEINRLMKKKK